MEYMQIKVVYETSPRLLYKEQDSKNLAFLKRRLQHFYPDAKIDFYAQSELKSNLQLAPGEVILNTSLFNPLLDQNILNKMISFATDSNQVISIEGAVPGSAPTSVHLGQNVNADRKIIFDNTQRKYNTQINLYRLKRVKIFNSFLTKFPDFHTWSMDQILNFCSTKEGVEFVLSYGENVKFSYYQNCPLCDSKELIEMHSDSGHPVLGFLTKESVFYWRCQSCELVFMNPHLNHESLHIYYDEYNFETPLRTPKVKDTLDNLNEENVSHLSNYQAISHVITRLPQKAACLDIGGGFGEFCQFIRNQRNDLQVEMFDFRINAQLAQELESRKIQAKQCDFVQENLGQNKYDLISNWEVIEHIDLKKLIDYFKRVYAALKPGGSYVFSTPDFADPFCRSLDFWAMAPGEHVSVLSRKVLEPYLKNIGFQVAEELHECVTMKSADRWYKYGQDAHAGLSSRADSWIINDFQKWDVSQNYRKDIRKRNLGSELILVLRKGE
jgi:2-polyprenyl-3-methyl-5-hydroxy-6-metoxy-1,4-benzoquinol methylase